MQFFNCGPNANTLPQSRRPLTKVLWACLVFAVGASRSLAQTAVISDAWWSYEQDCDGDNLRAGSLLENFARLNWFPDVVNCTGTLTVYEKVYFRPCGTATWFPIYTNAPHVIAGCRSIDQQYVDVELGSEGECRDYLIEIYRNGRATPDSIRSSANDTQLSEHREEALAEDLCASDMFTTCVALSESAARAVHLHS